MERRQDTHGEVGVSGGVKRTEGGRGREQEAREGLGTWKGGQCSWGQQEAAQAKEGSQVLPGGSAQGAGPSERPETGAGQMMPPGGEVMVTGTGRAGTVSCRPRCNDRL